MTEFLEIFEDEAVPGSQVALSVDADRALAWAMLDGHPWPKDRAIPRWRLTTAPLTDLVGVQTGFLTFSPRVREILDSYAVPGTLDWRAVLIEDREGVPHAYSVFHWCGPELPLNMTYSTFGPGGPIRRVFLRSAVDGLDILASTRSFLTLVVSKRVWEELVAIDASGMVVQRALVA